MRGTDVRAEVSRWTSGGVQLGAPSTCWKPEKAEQCYSSLETETETTRSSDPSLCPLPGESSVAPTVYFLFRL